MQTLRNVIENAVYLMKHIDITMLIKTIIIDDEPLHYWEVEQMLEELGGYKVLEIFQDADTAFSFIHSTKNTIDVIIMDIHLKGNMNGIELAQKISNKNIPILFITQDKSEEVYKKVESVSNHTFLGKPFHKFTLNSMIRLLLSIPLKEMLTHANSLLYVKIGNKREVIEPVNILWIESSRNHCTIHTTQNSYILRKSLTKLIETLPKDLFIAIHKSYVVQLSHIKRIDIKERAILVNDTLLPLGRNYIKSVRQYLVHLG